MKIFVYGTLQNSFGNEMALLLREYANYVTDGHIKGYLYLLDWYPGLVLDNTGMEVKGQIFEIHTKEEELLQKLDEYEGVDSGDYRRLVRTVFTKEGKYDCWIYESLIESDYVIKSGDFLDVKLGE